MTEQIETVVVVMYLLDRLVQLLGLGNNLVHAVRSMRFTLLLKLTGHGSRGKDDFVGADEDKEE